jgi:Flp pilus assembly protein TadG
MTSSSSQRGRYERGGALLIVLIAAVAVVGMAGVALDATHVGYMKARLQSTVDAMALAAAKRLDETGATTAACEAAREVLLGNARDFKELTRALPAEVVCPLPSGFTIEYSSTVAPFIGGSTPARYVRVVVASLSSSASLSTILGLTEVTTGASAIAGPSAPLATLCNLLPVAVCGAPEPPYFGFEPGRVYLLKGKKDAEAGVNVGDFHLLSPPPAEDTEAGLRRNFAGGFGSCVQVRNPTGDTPTIRIKPGTNVGPVSQGINTRFNSYQAGGQLTRADFPPDVLIGEPDPKLLVDSSGELRQGTRTITEGAQITGRNRIDYLVRLAQGSSAYDLPPLPASGGGALLRREVAVPIANCTAPINADALPIRGAGCFFLLQKMEGGAFESQLIAEFIADCEAGGRPGPNPGSPGGPYVIQIFRDPTSKDS